MTRTESSDGHAERQAVRVFAALLRERREEREWSFGQAEAVSGVTRSHWKKLESGRHQPGLIALLRIQRAFGLSSLDSLFGPLPSQTLALPGEHAQGEPPQGAKPLPTEAKA